MVVFSARGVCAGDGLHLPSTRRLAATTQGRRERRSGTLTSVRTPVTVFLSAFLEHILRHGVLSRQIDTWGSIWGNLLESHVQNAD